MQPLRILIADDHDAVRRGLRAVLQPQWDVCAEASDGREAVAHARTTRPDVALLDLKMPRLNGLDAAREILREYPATRVLLLTTQPSEELSDEAHRAGVDAVILKSDAETLAALLARIDRETIHLAGVAVGDRRHIGAFFASDAERYEVLGPFVAEGLARGEKAFHIVNGPEHHAHLARLMAAGVELGDAPRQRRWELLRWEDFYLVDGHFDQHATIDRIQNAVDGFPVTRLVAFMEWALQPKPGVKDIVEYESRLNDVIPTHSNVVVCAYDLARFDGRTIIDVMRVHPAVIVGGSLYDNPFYRRDA
ncbi:MAG TPA: MEDS domain-containing protein [Thermoanaerobaculia bacterium]|nr:MEDS domain-containing protein [Thermoanaerobaculia bacterium]